MPFVTSQEGHCLRKQVALSLSHMLIKNSSLNQRCLSTLVRNLRRIPSRV
ncbi:hypothetical protein Lalb_Chr08g0235551 [Lupinus albus]|uniref:Uncharacterized protein n=1 Tax=Lupinus albus TaxID=3870 RepID=A0A6A4Q3J9_LUPAL|nr:hypothetical protein Lalb_Chr23g0272711 [Lupinus albus]KAE9607677.1 hypothetical protein Lalb_Chr09g0332621 [Lupinus albus]KAE9608428.1 hypothetical protein Lalb_Chr08g0235551 [Lupinus albus]